MLITISLEDFKLMQSKASQVYYTEDPAGINMYMAKPPFIMKAHYLLTVDEETGVPKTEDMMMFKASFLMEAIKVLHVQEMQKIEMVMRQG